MLTGHVDRSPSEQKEQFHERAVERADPRKKKASQHHKRLTHPQTVGTQETYQAHVLLADDDPDMRHMIARSLRRGGYAVVELEDGGQLLEHLGDEVLASRYEQPDLVISDIRMPGLNGLEVLADLRRSNWAMPVVLVTAFGDQQTHEEARRLGATLLDKPFELDALLHVVRSILPSRF